MKARQLRLCMLLMLCLPAVAQDIAPSTQYHLAGHAWAPLNIPKERYLNALEGACRFAVKHQDGDGAIIDPYLHREVQYATPYFAYAVGTLVKAGRAKDLLPHGVAAMEHSTGQFGLGRSSIPDGHGEFFIPALAESIGVYQTLVPPETLDRWRERLRIPIAKIVGPLRINWMTYSMKGEWLRYKEGLVSHADAVSFIESAWLTEQRGRIFTTTWHLYHDRTSDPDTLSVEVVGRGNLLALAEDGYDGPSAAEIRLAAEDGTRTSLFLQDPTGQLPANGRINAHVWPDTGYQLAFQMMANEEWQAGDKEIAGVYQHASELSFASIARWRRTDGAWAGSYFVTKNHFDPALRVGYQDASHEMNYNCALMFHLAEAYNARKFEIPERPIPTEIGGYVLPLDAEFDTVMTDAGGMQMQLNLRGQIAKSNGNFWTPLGIVRVARAGWDSRIGPANGALTDTGGITFAPEFLEDGKWLRMASLSSRYRASWKTEFTNPALVRGILEYRPVDGSQGPVFQSEVWITPDGIYSETRDLSPGTVSWAMTWPLLQSDGNPLDVHIQSNMASASYSASGDEESFLSIGDSDPPVADGPSMLSSFGELMPLRVTPRNGVDRTFIYPHNKTQTAVIAVLQSFQRMQDGFTSDAGTVHGNVYIGKTIAGGEGRSIVLSGALLSFDQPCGFLLQMSQGRPITIETDRTVALTFHGRHVLLHRHMPIKLQ